MSHSTLWMGLLLLNFGCASAQTLGAAPASVVPPNMTTTVKSDNVDVAAFAQWENGTETPIQGPELSRTPIWLLWSEKNAIGFNGFWFGDSKLAGVRHMRLGFKTPINVGTVLVRGGGALSVLKADATYPGAMNDESQWVPAQRLVAGLPSTAEVEGNGYALWTLPPNTTTRAIRFSHMAQVADNRYGGWLGSLFVMGDRLINLAPQSLIVTNSNNQKATLLNNSSYENEAWENDVTDGSPLISRERPQQILMVWPTSVRLSGLMGLWAGVSALDAQIYTGPAERHPREATEADWKTVKSFSGLKNGYPTQLWPNRLDFGQEVETRAIRLKLTAPSEESHPHLSARTKGGKRVWLGEIMALQALGNAALQPVKLVAAQTNTPHPPIPVRFKLDKPGYVTLVIEGMSGKRVRNLVSETYFPAGDNVAWWDGTDDLGRDVDAARHGLYKIPSQFVIPGAYKVRGLVHDAIDLRYEFPVYSSGNPPWNLPDHTGAWLSNHSPPQAALFVPEGKSPSGKATVLLGSYVSEGRDGLAWVDLDGRKQGGKTWIGGIWTGAAYLALDAGPTADPKVYAYSGAAWQGELRLMALNMDGSDKTVLAAPWKFADANKDAQKPNDEMNGLAAYNGLLAVSLNKLNQILFFDLKTGQVAGTVALPQAQGLAFDKQGQLYALSGTKLVRFASIQNPKAVPAPQTIISSGLEDPRGLALDEKGQFYISDRGQSHQVKIFDAAGKLVWAIGKAGVPSVGTYDPLHMNNPDGLAVDSKNQIWVTENDYMPKRVSVWMPDGKLVKAFYGPSKYGGGGTLDSNDKTKFYYADEQHGSMEFKLDWAKGDFQLTNVLYREESSPFKLPIRSAAPEFPIYRGGQRYFTNCYNSSPTGGQSTVLIFLDKNGVVKPIAAAGRANDWDVLKGDAFKPSWPAGVDLRGDLWQGNGRNQAFFIWSDDNSDSDVQPNEVKWQVGIGGGVTVMADLSFCISRLNGKAFQFAPTGFSANGVPRYELANAQIIAEDVAVPASSGGDQLLIGQDGLAVTTLALKPFHPLSISGSKNKIPLWSYPNLWPGLHASHEAAKPDQPGQVIGATRLLGGFIAPKGSDAGQLWGVNGNMGNMYLFTADGLFVSTLFEDVRQGKLWQMPTAERNMKLENISLHDENFWPTLTQTPDGLVYVMDGSNNCLVRVDGLSSIRRLPESQIRVSTEDLKNAQTYLIAAEAERQRTQGRGILEATLRPTAPIVDGKLDDWAGAAWVDIDKSGAGANFNSTSKPYDFTATVSISGGRLYAAWKTGDTNLLKNSGEMPTAPFKTGGALDLMLGTNPKADPKRANPVEGDIRLLVTEVRGKPVALIYRAVVAGTKTPVPFSSPWRTITLDKVDDVSSQVQLAGSEGNYEISIPLAALGLTPQAGMTLQGDIGVLRGDGSQTTARTYWSNKATGITADVPSEAQLTPNLWGQWHLKPTP